MAVSQKIRQYMAEGGWIRRVFEEGLALKAQIGAENVFDLSLGNPVIEPPAEFKDELRRLASEPMAGMHRYMPNPGYMETRQAVAGSLSEETGLPFEGGDIVMTCGAAAAANVVLKTILNPGDEVIILAPYFFEYLYYIDNHDGVAVVVNTTDRFRLDLPAIEQAVTPRTRAIIVNSPNNPSGVVYSPEEIAGLAELLQRKQSEHGTEIFLISDEPYKRIIFDGMDFPQIVPSFDNSIIVTSHAKDLALPGERIGFIAINPNYGEKEELGRRVQLLQSHPGIRERSGADAARGTQLAGRKRRPGLLPAQARLPAHRPDGDGLRHRQAGGRVLPVSESAHRGRRGIHPRAFAVERAGGAGPGFRNTGLLPHFVLRRGLGAGGSGGRTGESRVSLVG